MFGFVHPTAVHYLETTVKAGELRPQWRVETSETPNKTKILSCLVFKDKTRSNVVGSSVCSKFSFQQFFSVLVVY